MVIRPEGTATQGMTAAIKHGHTIVRDSFCPLTLCFEKKKQNVKKTLRSFWIRRATMECNHPSKKQKVVIKLLLSSPDHFLERYSMTYFFFHHCMGPPRHPGGTQSLQ